ncbi:NAD(P)/FAD-dependent oxidoreductase [bacterium]|nr:NAD(P)/FAD-dependent oxidoreductase [bacterium]
MTPAFDVLIIGGGVTGAAIARELSQYKLSLALLEKEAELAFGVSKSNSGIIHPGTQNPADSLKGKLCVEGNRLVRQLAMELGVHFVEVGELIVIFHEQDRPALLRIKEEAEHLGVSGLELVDRTWLQTHEPLLNSDIVAALFAPTAGIISPYRFVYALSENAQRNGVEIYLEHKVTGIKKHSSGFLVRTENQVAFQTRYVINAAGLYADEIARLIGIQNIEIHPRKGEEYLLDKKQEHLTRHLIFPLPDKTSKGILIIKTSDGNPMIGPTAEPVESKEDLTTTEAGLNKILISAQKLLPTISKEDIIAYFAGVRPVSGNDFIIRHEAAVPGFMQVAGIQSPGLTAAPAIAKMVGKLLQEQGLKLKKKRIFHKQRQASPHLFNLPLAQANRLIHRNPAFGDIVCRCEMVSAQEIREAVQQGARTLDGIKFRTRAQAGRCHGGFCTTRIMKILAEELNLPLTEVTKRGPGSEIIMDCRGTKFCAPTSERDANEK